MRSGRSATDDILQLPFPTAGGGAGRARAPHIVRLYRERSGQRVRERSRCPSRSASRGPRKCWRDRRSFSTSRLPTSFRGVLVAERVPTDALCDAKFHCYGTEQVTHDGLGPIRPSTAASWTGENPVVPRSIFRMLAPFSQCFFQVIINRDSLL